MKLIDTDVLIWYLRGNENAYEVIENQNGFYVSVVTYIEMVQGMRNKQELKEFREAFRNWRTKIIYINEEISVRAMFYIERHFLTHSLQLADALICATAVVNGLPLLTANDKHYKMIKELEIHKFKP
ncbi:MAG: type II toxin-antitoxin system VapC family toxin [Calditrichaeota bacterium]|nr:MAG: type II toxin-antitoxin system VapC family toxin [Calditrichota bacterium]